jgi:phasin
MVAAKTTQAKTSATKAKTAAKQTVKTVETAIDDAASTVAGIFSTNGFEVPEVFRSMTENGISTARDNYSQFKEKAEEATDIIEETFETARDGVLDLQHKTLDAAKQNTDAAFDFAKQMMSMTSVADAIQLQAKFAREQFDTFVDYAKDFQSSAAKVAEQTAGPSKKAYSQAVSAK